MNWQVIALLAALGLPILVACGFRYIAARAESRGLGSGAGFIPRTFLGRQDTLFREQDTSPQSSPQR